MAPLALCSVLDTARKTDNTLNVSVLHVIKICDSDSSPHQQRVCGVGENRNANYCSFSVLLLTAVSERQRKKNATQSSAKRRTASTLME